MQIFYAQIIQVCGTVCAAHPKPGPQAAEKRVAHALHAAARKFTETLQASVVLEMAHRH